MDKKLKNSGTEKTKLFIRYMEIKFCSLSPVDLTSTDL